MLENNNKAKIARVLVVSQDGNITSYIEDTLETLSKTYEVVLEVERIDHLDLSGRIIPLVIFDNVDNKLIALDIISSHLNSIPFFVYANDKYHDGMIEDLFKKSFDYIIDKKLIKSNELALGLINSFNRCFQTENKTESIAFDDFKIDTYERKVWKGTEEIRLTDIEFRMLMLFVKNPEEVLSIKRIFKDIWGIDDDDTSRIVTQYVHRLKTKIGKDYISNISNIGYVWNKKK